MTQARRLGQYELLEIVGQGEILSLHRARDTERDRHVMLKLVRSHLLDDADVLARFRRRAEKVLSLQHPNILPILDVSFEKDAFYLVTDMPEGESLERRCAGRSPMEVDDVLSIISQVAEALDYAHDQGVIHRDVQPSNIYLEDKKAMLTGFYLLEALNGTPVYLAPEQLDETSAEIAGRRSDTYALGVIVYEMLTGRPPFEGTAADVAAAHLTQRPLSPRVHNPDLFPTLDAIVLKSMAKQPQSRYQSAGQLATALHKGVQTAQTRRMSDDGVFDNAKITDAVAYESPSLISEGSALTWAWVGLGILLIVMVVSIILLATG